MVLVAGATGILGGEICRRLRAKRAPVRALVRTSSDPHRVDNLRRLGASIAVGDLKDANSLREACRDVYVVMSTANSIVSRQIGDSFDSVDIEGQKNLIDAAVEAGAGRFIYTSVSSNFPSDNPLVQAKREVEQYLKDSGIAYTILRPTFFMEVWLSPRFGFDYGTGRATIYGSGQNPISWISLQDVARFAVECLHNPDTLNETIELGGREPLRPDEVVRIFEELAGRRFQVQRVPEEALDAQQGGGADPVQKAFASLTLGYAAEDQAELPDSMKAYAVQLVSVRDYASRVLSA